jgi:hypothetical protein
VTSISAKIMNNSNHLTLGKLCLKSGPCRFGGILLAFLALSPTALALDPPPGGGYFAEITALGQDALFNQPNVPTASNTAIGFETLYFNTLGSSDTAVGDSALHDNTTGDGNTALGSLALEKNTTGFSNTGIGVDALRYNTTGESNTAVGDSAVGLSNGSGNTGVGDGAMFFTTTGSWNTAVGQNALAFNTTGSENIAMGHGALNQNTTGGYNIGIGPISGQKLRTGSYNIDIGNTGAASDTRTIRLGAPKSQKNTYIAGINGVTVAGGVGVVIDTDGHLGTVTSSARYKEAIKPMDKSSEAILSLKPVSFRYKHELDPQGIPQFGLVAEEVAKIDPDLVARDEAGKPYTVRYEAVNAMLLNEFLKEHRKVEEQSGEIADLKATVAALQSVAREQAAQIRKVSAAVETQRSSSRMVANDQ